MRTAGRPRHLLRNLLIGLAVLALLCVGVVWKVGPRYGYRLFPPSPSEYADDALTHMRVGYFAEGPAWEKARDEAVAATREAKSYGDTLPPLRKALEVAGGKHSHLFDSGQTLAGVDKERPLPQLSTADGITTVTVPKASADDSNFLQQHASTMSDGLDKARSATTCGWIVDIRHNHGGDMNPMLAGLAPLLGDGKVGGSIDRVGNVTDISLQQGQVSQNGATSFTGPSHPRLAGPVAVLQGPDAGSSGEVAILAFKGVAGARSFGGPTAGYSTANQVYHLYDGTEMLLTSGVDTDRNGTKYGDVVQPDQNVPVDTAEKAAATWLHTQCAQ